MLKRVEKEIDGNRYSYQPLQLTPARELLDKLIQKLGPAVGDAAAGLGGEGGVDTAILGAIGQAVSRLATQLDPAFHREIADKIAAQIQVEQEGRFVPFRDLRELLLGQSLLTETKIILWALEVQYSDFFGLLRSRLAAAAPLIPTLSVSDSEAS